MAAQTSVLLTRPEAQSRQFASEWNLADAVISPVLAIRPVPFTVDLARYAYLIFTSVNAVRALADRSDVSGKSGYAVGDRTALAGAEYGMRLVSAGGDGQELVKRILRDRPAGRGLYLHGVHRALEVEKPLNSSGLETDSLAVYDQVECPLTDAARALLMGTRPVILPVFSARTAKILRQQAQGANAPLTLIAMSSAVLAAWQCPPATTIVLKSPTSNAMGEEILHRLGRAP